MIQWKIEVVFQITIDNLKQIVLKKDEEKYIFFDGIFLYKFIKVQILQSQVQDSVENKETHDETQCEANHESREASALGFPAPDPSTVLARVAKTSVAW